MKLSQIAIALFTSLMMLSCNNQNQEKMNANKNELNEIFPKGEKGSEDLFTGNAYNVGLVHADSVFTTAVGIQLIKNNSK